MPLLFIYIMSLFLSACSTTVAPPSFQTTGYITDQGGVRIWRKNNSKHVPLSIVVRYDYFNGKRDDVYLNYHTGKLLEILRHQEHEGKTTDHIRFDLSGNVTFMQHSTGAEHSSIKPDDINTLKYIASEIVKLTDLLALAEVKLGQGYIEHGKVTDCTGKPVELNLSSQQRDWINNNTTRDIRQGIAWLASPSGDQLFLLTRVDYCQSIPEL